MILSSKANRRWQGVWAGLALAAATWLAAACGGATSQYDPFVAQRVFAFGDDNSALTADGKRYAINGVNATTGVIDCNLEPLWVQTVASYYGFVFAQCNTATPPADPKAFNKAAAGAKVADIAAQVEAQVAVGGFRDKDLALVTGGTQDILELYAQFPLQSEATLMAEAGARGERMAAVVNRLVNLGAKVIVANLPDLGLSPYARAEGTANAASGFDRAQLISRLTIAFNERLGVKVLLDGRFVGLAQMDLRTQAAGRSPSSFGLADISTGFCSVAPPDCTTATPVVPAAAASQYLWADGTRLSSSGQSLMGSLALERAQRNPF